MTQDHVINQIVEELTHGGITGWCPVEKAIDLACTVFALRPKVVLETGVWGGRSLLPMALACEAIDCGVVIGVDPWSSEASIEGYTAENAGWWGQQDHEKIYRGFMHHVDRLGLRQRVGIHRMKSMEAPVPEVLDLFHADSQHTDLCVREINRYAINVRIGGIVCLDDLSWQNSGDQPIARAVEALKALGFIELYRVKQRNGEWGMFQRVAMPTVFTAPPPKAKVMRKRSSP